MLTHFMPQSPAPASAGLAARHLARAAFAVVGLIVVVGLLRGQPFVEMLLFGVALAVAVVPEALPAVVTISLAIGVQRMVKRNALVRRLPAVETLGSTSVICSDKTGTLTRDQMTTRRVHAGGRTMEVSGSGYEPTGEFLQDGAPRCELALFRERQGAQQVVRADRDVSLGEPLQKDLRALRILIEEGSRGGEQQDDAIAGLGADRLLGLRQKSRHAILIGEGGAEDRIPCERLFRLIAERQGWLYPLRRQGLFRGGSCLMAMSKLLVGPRMDGDRRMDLSAQSNRLQELLALKWPPIVVAFQQNPPPSIQRVESASAASILLAAVATWSWVSGYSLCSVQLVYVIPRPGSRSTNRSYAPRAMPMKTDATSARMYPRMSGWFRRRARKARTAATMMLKPMEVSRSMRRRSV